MTLPSRVDKDLPPACLERLQRVLSDSALTGALEAPLLHAFYRHCARQPAAANRRRLPLALKSLLYRYPFLRPAVQMELTRYLSEQWPRFAAEVSATASDDRPPEPENPPGPVESADPPSQAVPSSPRAQSLPASRRDWFERLLDGVRILLFL